jgi:hypothetical protein
VTHHPHCGSCGTLLFQKSDEPRKPDKKTKKKRLLNKWAFLAILAGTFFIINNYAVVYIKSGL